MKTDDLFPANLSELIPHDPVTIFVLALCGATIVCVLIRWLRPRPWAKPGSPEHLRAMQHLHQKLHEGDSRGWN